MQTTPIPTRDELLLPSMLHVRQCKAHSYTSKKTEILEHLVTCKFRSSLIQNRGYPASGRSWGKEIASCIIPQWKRCRGLPGFCPEYRHILEVVLQGIICCLSRQCDTVIKSRDSGQTGSGLALYPLLAFQQHNLCKRLNCSMLCFSVCLRKVTSLGCCEE